MDTYGRYLQFINIKCAKRFDDSYLPWSFKARITKLDSSTGLGTAATGQVQGTRTGHVPCQGRETMRNYMSVKL